MVAFIELSLLSLVYDDLDRMAHVTRMREQEANHGWGFCLDSLLWVPPAVEWIPLEHLGRDNLGFAGQFSRQPLARVSRL
jgi:hypothetical protein